MQDQDYVVNTAESESGLHIVCPLHQIFSCTVLAALTSAAPQRSIQLGGEGPRAVQLGGAPIYQQQLAFGPPSGLHQQPQFAAQQFAPAPAAPSRFRVAQVSPSGGFQPLVYQQQQGAAVAQPRPFALPGFQAVPQTPTRQPVPLSSPLASANAPHAEEEYDDDEYDDAPAAPSPRPQQVITSSLPIRASPQPVTAQPQLQRVVLSQQTPQRLVIPQQFAQPQAAPQQISRRPVPQRVIAASPAPAAAAPIVRQQVQPARANAVVASGDKKNRVTTPPPVQTLNRYQRTNPDGSMTWGYENEDGTFKEETLGVDCVVRGKYGYVDPDGNKREYEYQQGNPCDPNKKDQEEELEEEEEEAAEAPAARPRPVLVQRRPLQQIYQGQ